MARSRNIKPSFFKNEQLVELAMDRRLLFVGLWMLADREGRLEDRPKRIKMEVFPADDVNVEKALNELHEAGFITRYMVDGARFIEVCNFTKHQNPHHREPPSIIPKPEAYPLCQPPPSLRLTDDAIPEEPEASPEPAPELPGLAVLIPDSGFRIPDSIEKTLSGKAPDAPPKTSRHKPDAIAILAFLNETAGRSYKPVEVNLEFIEARLKEGATVEELRAVISRKCAQWLADPKMADYLRPATLFNRTKFAQYQGETGTAKAARRAVV